MELTIKKAFRLLYTAIYLTVIMLEILGAAGQPDYNQRMAYYGVLFIWVTLWGTKCFWAKTIICKIRADYKILNHI